MLSQTWAFTSGMLAFTPADQVFQRPTSNPSDRDAAAAAIEFSEPPSPLSPPPIPPKSKSMYITCFLMVR